MAFLEPRPVAARRGDPPIGGDGDVVVLAEEAARLAGSGAVWLGWWSKGTDLIMAAAGVGMNVTARSLDPSLTLLAAALPIPTPSEQEMAGGDPGLATRIALWRAAQGPLLRDPVLSERLAATLPTEIRRTVLAADAVAQVATLDEAALLWPVTRLLLSEDLRRHLAVSGTDVPRQPLVLAPPPLLGRIPWAALPITDPAIGQPRRLIEAADLTIALPASLSASLPVRVPEGGGVLLVADPLGDLRNARRLHVPDAERLGYGHRPATRDAFIAACRDAAMLIVAGHVRPGEPADPAASAVLLRDDLDGVAALTVADLAKLHVPTTCVLLGCDGAGAATGNVSVIT
jgi:hypothetical protein